MTGIPQNPLPKTRLASSKLQKKLIIGGLWVLAASFFSVHPSTEFFGILWPVLSLQAAINLAIERAIIQNPRRDPAFLNTAWALQIMSGIVCLLLGSIVIGFFALFFKLPSSQWLPILIVSIIFSLSIALTSTKIASAERKLTVGKVMGMRIFVALMSGVVVFVSSHLLTSPYQGYLSRMIASAVSAVLIAILSHTLLKGRFNTWQWDKTAFYALYRYGIWILGIFILEFLLHLSKNALLSHFQEPSSLGLYAIAFQSRSIFMRTVLFSSVHLWILFPLYSKLIRSNSSQFFNILSRTRLITIGIASIVALLSILFGHFFLSQTLWLFPSWQGIMKFVHIFSVQGILIQLIATYDDILYAQAKTPTLFFLTLIQCVVELVLMFVGIGFGVKGMVIGTVVASYFTYTVRAIYFSKQSLWQPKIDLPFLGITSIVLIQLLVNFGQ